MEEVFGIETFKINCAYYIWAKKAKLPKNMEKKYNTAAEIALKCLEPDSPSWKIITILYSYVHGVTGEKMHFVRIDRVSKTYYNDGSHKKNTVSEHKFLTDAKLQQYKQYIITE